MLLSCSFASVAGVALEQRGALSEGAGGRTAAAWRRARRAQVSLGALAVAVFLAGGLLARANVPGHARPAARPLGVPPRFLRAMRRDALQGGVVAPAASAPQTATSSS
jgi:hypothetical protein